MCHEYPMALAACVLAAVRLNAPNLKNPHEGIVVPIETAGRHGTSSLMPGCGGTGPRRLARRGFRSQVSTGPVQH